LQTLDIGGFVIPFVERFDVHGAHMAMPLAQKVGDEMTANETPAAANHYGFRIHIRGG
jgi:hypothetical protein